MIREGPSANYIGWHVRHKWITFELSANVGMVGSGVDSIIEETSLHLGIALYMAHNTSLHPAGTMDTNFVLILQRFAGWLMD